MTPVPWYAFALFISFWFVIPVLIGFVLLPLVPFFVQNRIYPQKKLPSFLPFVLSLYFLVVVANYIWTNYFEGWLYHEWDPIFTQFSLVHYQSPLIDGTGTWILNGITLWHLYGLWAVITLGIYWVAFLVTVFFNKKRKNFDLQKKVLQKSISYMFAIGAIVAILYSHLLPFK